MKQCHRSLQEIALFLFLLLHVCCSIQMTYFKVPKFVRLRDHALLECHFRMTEGTREKLLSVKWYRIGESGELEEFYSYQPGKNPPAKKYSLPGIRVDMGRSNVQKVMLKKVNLDTSGRFRCEVTSRIRPKFDSKVNEEQLTVLELPEEGPVISGGRAKYHIGEQLELNCTSPRTYPPTNLYWYLNGQKIDSSTHFPIHRGSKNGLFRSRIGINITISRGLFHYGKMKVKCVGVVEEGVLRGSSQRNSHEIETLLLPEALKKERTEVFIVPLMNAGSRLMDPLASTLENLLGAPIPLLLPCILRWIWS